MHVLTARLLNFGSLTTDPEEQTNNPSSITGYFLQPSEIRFITQVDHLPAELGLRFGIEYIIESKDKHLTEILLEFTCRIAHPALTNPINSQTTRETIEQKNNFLSEPGFDYYFFEYDWEVKTGTWTFQIIAQEKILLEKSFEIT